MRQLTKDTTISSKTFLKQSLIVNSGRKGVGALFVDVTKKIRAL